MKAIMVALIFMSSVTAFAAHRRASPTSPKVVTGPILGYNPGDAIYCDFEPTWPSGHSTTYVTYDGQSSTSVEYYGTDATGAPVHWIHYYDTTEIVTNIPPFYNNGFAVAVFAGEVPLVHLEPGSGGKWNDPRTYPYIALWGNPELQGSPDNPNFEGVCWTDSQPPGGGQSGTRR